MISTYRNAASKKNITLKSNIGYHSKVYADKDLLETIFRNLISNAIKFTKPNGEIILNAKKEEEFTRISISDTGVGISEENLGKLFSIDIRSSTKGTEEESGTGLGLLVVKEFVETNGGAIRVISTPGKGSEFSFTVPSKMSEE
jgi:signal transduction histidine kinase